MVFHDLLIRKESDDRVLQKELSSYYQSYMKPPGKLFSRRYLILQVYYYKRPTAAPELDPTMSVSLDQYKKKE